MQPAVRPAATAPASEKTQPDAWRVARHVLKHNSLYYVFWFAALGLAAAYLTILSSASVSRQANLQPAVPKPASSNQSASSASSAPSQSSSSNTTQVVVNGQHIPVPTHGELHTAVPAVGGNTDINISQDSSGPGESSLHVQVHSQASSEVTMVAGD